MSLPVSPRARSQGVENQSLHLSGPTHSQDFILQTPCQASGFRVPKGGFLAIGVFLPSQVIPVNNQGCCAGSHAPVPHCRVGVGPTSDRT